jgi:hypothetical protein
LVVVTQTARALRKALADAFPDQAERFESLTSDLAFRG